MRKSELVLCDGDEWDQAHLSEASVSWQIRGVRHAQPSRAQLESLTNSDYAILQPPRSKTDPFARIWGSRPVWLPLRARDPINAARALRDRFLHTPPQPATPTPLLLMRNRSPMRGAYIDATLKDLLRRQMTAAEAKGYTPHSFRVYLATSLRAAGCTDAQIQALCRWQSFDSLRIYALLDASTYGHLLDKAMATDHDALRHYSLPVLGPESLPHQQEPSVTAERDEEDQEPHTPEPRRVDPLAALYPDDAIN